MRHNKNNSLIHSYTLTKTASYIGYVVQAITINFTPLLFVCFMGQYSLSMREISALVTLTFVFQFSIDFLSVFLLRRVGYRALVLAAHALSCAGLVLLCVLPEIMDSFLGLCIAVGVYSSGSGFIEVVVSPIIESCPSRNKAAQMSFLHSFYCWGQVAAVGISTLYFAFFGVEAWKTMTLIWACIPLLNILLFSLCPLDVDVTIGTSKPLRALFGRRDFLLLMLIIMCSGAAEIALSQWASAYCETALGVPKTVGDIAGPMGFAVCMGISRLGYAVLGDRLKLEWCMLASSVLCAIGYLIVSLSPSAVLSLVGFGVCGLSVGVLWPGAFSLASKRVEGGGSMYALLSFSGDAGCTIGPLVCGLCASSFGDDIGIGLLISTVFPLALCIFMLCFNALGEKDTQK